MPASTSNLHYFNPAWITPTHDVLAADLCVYGGTAAGVIAAVTAARLGQRVVLLQPGLHLGGMTTGGLGWTDYGRQHVIGGAARQFYRAVGQHYGKAEEWHFEPHVATAVLTALLAATDVQVRRAQYLERVQKDGTRITAITLLGGLTVRAKVFIDATYEGDLLAQAGVSYAVGREGNATYGETLAGIQIHPKHQFGAVVDPYVVAGDPASGLLPQIEAEDFARRVGEGDHRVQAYNFRMCMTDDPALKVAWQRPAGFEPQQYVLATRWFNGPKDAYNEQLHGDSTVPDKFDIFPNLTPGGHHKTDTNNHGPISSDFIGRNWGWPNGSYAQREAIFQAHVTYQQGLYWHLANDPAIPARYRAAYSAWGLPSDEFTDTGHWPHQLYVREARRMVSDYVVTEHDCTKKVRSARSVGMGSYNMDSHNCTRFVKVENGRARVLNEGDIQVPPTDPYPIDAAAVMPRARECSNLLVPVCLSASHIAYGSARMEPVFMVLGESCARLAVHAAQEGCAVQAVDYPALRAELLAAGQVLEAP